MVCSETVVLNAVSGVGHGPTGWEAGGATLGDDVLAPGGTEATFTGKVPNKRFFVPIADTTMTEQDTIYSVQVRVLAKADTNMSGTYDGIRIALSVGTNESRDRAIDELDTVYTYYSNIWANNPVTGLTWTWDDINAMEAGVFTAKRRQLTFSTYYVDHIQVVVTYGNGNSPPVASNVEISGAAEVGQTLSGSYMYSDAEGDPEGTSLFQWYRAESANPADTLKAAISNAVEKDYLLKALEEGKYVSFEVTPVASAGVLMGIPVESDMIGPILPDTGTAPVATNVTITGQPRQGETLVGRYDYSDADGDREGESTYRWLRDGSAITGARDTSYRLTASDVGSKISFEVTPVALTGIPKTGDPAVSEEVAIGGMTGLVNHVLPRSNFSNGDVKTYDVKGRLVSAFKGGTLPTGAYIKALNSTSGIGARKVSLLK
ncbi:MAG: hypothetical protein JW768_15740 [Chitinispirillaceae bacterium]|nr:hypothetical protein [Chitinispirillaceae bacterium]